MTRHFEAVYEQGVLRPLEPLVLQEQQHVRLTFEEQPDDGHRFPLIQKSNEPVNNRHEEIEWLATKLAPFAGEWVAIKGSSLIAHGAKLADVRDAALAAGVKEPFFASVPADSHLPFGGW